MEKLKYPIGKFTMPTEITDADLSAWIKDIKSIPDLFSAKANALTEDELNTPYRPGGWTARQVIHHLADSHINAYCRFKWVLTEDSPTIKPYFEDRWATLNDSTDTPIQTSLDLLSALHSRWSILLRGMDRSDFDKYYIHPEYGSKYTLGSVSKLYAWHGQHHLGHLSIIRPD